MRIAMIQMASASGDVERNIGSCFFHDGRSGRKELTSSVLPELWQ